MDCPTCEAMVDAYVDGELTASESAAFERALEACPDCRRRLEAARTMSGLLRELPAEPAPGSSASCARSPVLLGHVFPAPACAGAPWRRA